MLFLFVWCIVKSCKVCRTKLILVILVMPPMSLDALLLRVLIFGSCFGSGAFITVNVVVFAWGGGGNFCNGVTKMLRMVANFTIYVYMPTYFCHGVISVWWKFRDKCKIAKITPM